MNPLLIGVLCRSSLQAGLIGNWPLLDGSGLSAADRSGLGQIGTLENGPVWDASGLEFTDADDIVSIATQWSALGPQTWTWRMTAQSGGAGSLGRIIHKRDSADGHPSICIDDRGGSNGTRAIRFEYVINANNNRIYKSADAVVTYGVSTHFAIAFNSDFGAAPMLYINGGSPTSMTVVSVPGSVSPSGDDNALFLGNRADEVRGFDGIISHVRVYNRILSAAEIAAIAALDA